MNNNNNIEDKSFNGTNPFRTDNDYFENFNSKLQSRIESFEEIKTIAPILSSIPKYNPFEVPEDYFDELPSIVQQRCIELQTKTSFMEWLLLLIKPRFAVPVLTTLLVAVAGIHFINKNAELSGLPIVEELTIEDQLYTIDEAMIIEKIITDATTDNSTFSTEDNDIKDYLIENDIDETNLNYEF